MIRWSTRCFIKKISNYILVQNDRSTSYYMFSFPSTFIFSRLKKLQVPSLDRLIPFNMCFSVLWTHFKDFNFSLKFTMKSSIMLLPTTGSAEWSFTNFCSYVRFPKRKKNDYPGHNDYFVPLPLLLFYKLSPSTEIITMRIYQ